MNLPTDIKKIIDSYYTYFDSEFMNSILSLLNIQNDELFYTCDSMTHHYTKEYEENILMFSKLFSDRKLQPRNKNEFIEILKKYKITDDTINKIIIICNHKINLKDLDKYKHYSTGIDLNIIKDKSMKIVLAPEDKFFTMYELMKAIHLIYSNMTISSRNIIEEAFEVPYFRGMTERVRVDIIAEITEIIPNNNILTLILNDIKKYDTY